MKAKVLILGLVCLFFISGCKKQLPTSSDINLARIVYFYAHDESVRPGNATTLFWSTIYATTVMIDQGVGEVSSGKDAIAVWPEDTTTYTMTASNERSEVKSSVRVEVRAKPAEIMIKDENLELIREYINHRPAGGFVHVSGVLMNVGDTPAINIVLHVPLINESSNEFYHLEYSFIGLVLEEYGDKEMFDYTWHVSWEIYSQIIQSLTWESMYVTCDETY